MNHGRTDGGSGIKNPLNREYPGSASATVERIMILRCAAGFFLSAIPHATKMRKLHTATMLTERKGGSPVGKFKLATSEAMTAQGPKTAIRHAQAAVNQPSLRWMATRSPKTSSTCAVRSSIHTVKIAPCT